MKKFLLLLVIIPAVNFAQIVPNGNFENWTTASGYNDPTGWDTPNSVSSSLGVITVYKETSIVQEGSSSVKIQTKSILGTPIPGLITLGDFNINVLTFEATITGGTPFTGRPESMSGYYQYEPIFNDEAFIGIILLKQNGANWDTVADGAFTSTSTLTTWTPFLATLNYRTSDIPTHLNIIIMSSDRNAPQPNSTLYIDNLTFSYPASVDEAGASSISVSYSDDVLYVNMSQEHHEISNIHIYSVDGKLMGSYYPDHRHMWEMKVQLPGLPAGLFIASVTSANGSVVQKKFIVSR
jgi:hypothetical protein